jgi:prepilin-type N-terminal cleavage/methylation domain-containing protein
MKQQKGFTLVEAAVAIGIVAILSGIIIPLVMKNLNDAKFARALNDINVIVAAVVHQQTDIGHRPMAAAGPNGADGTGNNIWASTPNIPGLGVPAVAPAAANNTFDNLFGQPATLNATNVLFSIPAGTPVEHRYRGPYLGSDMAIKSDPWGHAYVIFGYNAFGQASDGPIWVASAGPLNMFPAASVTPAANAYPLVWTQPADPKDRNIAVRAN